MGLYGVVDLAPGAETSLGGANLDAFSRIRISPPKTLFYSQGLYDSEPLVLGRGASGVGVEPAWSPNTRMLAVSATAGTGECWIQSFAYIPYQPGKSQLVLISCVPGPAVAGAVLDIGYGDADNGIFFRQAGASNQIVRRTSISGSMAEEVVNQTAWSVDTLLGQPGSVNPSGYTLDATKDMILIIDLQFLSMGRVRVGFDIGGEIVYAHEFRHTNVLSVPYMQTASLPVGMTLTVTETEATKTSYWKCAAVIAEGGEEERAAARMATPDAAVTAASGTRTHLMCIRPKTTFNGVPNRATIHPFELFILVTGNFPVYWELCVGATFTEGNEPTYADVNATYSGVEYGTGGTLAATPLTIAAGYVAASAQSVGLSEISNIWHYPITLDRAGDVRNLGTLYLIVTGIGGSSATRAVLNFEELR